MSSDAPDTEPIDIVTGSRFRVGLAVQGVSIAVGRSIIRRVVTFVDEDAESTFLVAFTEIMANAIDEHLRIGSDDLIGVEVLFGSCDIVRVQDRGHGFRLDETRVQDDASAERGRGLSLARALVPDLAIDSGPMGTTVSLPLAGLGIVR